MWKTTKCLLLCMTVSITNTVHMFLFAFFCSNKFIEIIITCLSTFDAIDTHHLTILLFCGFSLQNILRMINFFFVFCIRMKQNITWYAFVVVSSIIVQNVKENDEQHMKQTMTTTEKRNQFYSLLWTASSTESYAMMRYINVSVLIAWLL